METKYFKGWAMKNKKTGKYISHGIHLVDSLRDAVIFHHKSEAVREIKDNYKGQNIKPVLVCFKL